MEVPPIEDPHLLRAHEQCARHVGGGRESANVAGQEPRPSVGHPVFAVQQAQVPKRDHPIHGFRDLGAATEPHPGLLIEIVLDGETRARLPVEMQAPGRVEQLLHLRVRHLLAARPVAHEEPPTERVGLALLRRHDDAQDLADTLDLHVDRRVC